MEQGERLKRAREKRGFSTAAEAARFLKVPYGTYSGHENGSRGIKAEDLRRYATAFRVSLPWLAYGEGAPDDRNFVQLIGYVEAGDNRGVVAIDDHAQGAGLEPIESPFANGRDMVAVQVRGNSMRPAYNDGDLIFYCERRDGDVTDLLGREAIVALTDGRKFLKTIERGSRTGLWTLLSHNSEPIRDVEIEWAARVRYVERR